MSDKLAIELLREWDWHNNKHHCYYLESNDSGVDECPADFPTLRAFLESREFPVENVIGRFFGRDLDEPNFRSRISGQEFTVNPSDVVSIPKGSISDRRKSHTLRSSRAASRYYTPTTDAALEARRQRATGEAVENEQAAWQVEAMDYFKERLDEIHESMARAFSGVMAEQSRHTTVLDGIVKRLDERSESRVAAEPKVVITLENVPADVAETLQAELATRVERIMARRKREQA